jgi:hypothetical protein
VSCNCSDSTTELYSYLQTLPNSHFINPSDEYFTKIAEIVNGISVQCDLPSCNTEAYETVNKGPQALHPQPFVLNLMMRSHTSSSKLIIIPKSASSYPQ